VEIPQEKIVLGGMPFQTMTRMDEGESSQAGKVLSQGVETREQPLDCRMTPLVITGIG
jgi:hypothetical protein